MTSDDLDWRQRGACRDEDPELFHPNGTKGPALKQLEEAKTVCGRCPVRQECLDYALRTGVEYGVYGGMSEGERRALRRGNSRPTPRPKPAAPPFSRGFDAAQGQDAIRKGVRVEDVAAQFGVSVDTARRWRREAEERAS